MPRHISSCLLYTSFACVGFMIRYNSFFVVACFLFFLCLIDLLVKQCFSFRREYWKKNLRYIVSFVILFACAAALFFVNSAAYNRDPEWKYFMEYSETRSDLLDYGLPKYYDHQEELEKLGITSTDLVMLLSLIHILQHHQKADKGNTS